MRAQVAASTTRDAVDRAVDGLSQRLDRLCRHLTATEAGATTFTPDEWDMAPPATPAGLVGAGSRPDRVTRRKTCALAVQRSDLAAFTMDMRDYRFYLFADEEGRPCVVYRGGLSGYRLIGAGAPTGSECGSAR